VYRAEPYVVAADVYAVAPHTGRGGWTWYTGSAGWMYRLITVSLLGLHLEVDRLHFAPLVPKHWTSFKIHYRYRETFYHITFHIDGSAAGRTGTGAGGGTSVKREIVDGLERPDKTVLLVDDRLHHDATVDVE
jgi:cyclic beta-1,2-glucan synthetase